MKTTASSELFTQARVVLPGGVNSPVQAWGPLILRHAHPEVLEASRR